WGPRRWGRGGGASHTSFSVIEAPRTKSLDIAVAVLRLSGGVPGRVISTVPPPPPAPLYVAQLVPSVTVRPRSVQIQATRPFAAMKLTKLDTSGLFFSR